MRKCSSGQVETRCPLSVVEISSTSCIRCTRMSSTTIFWTWCPQCCSFWPPTTIAQTSARCWPSKLMLSWARCLNFQKGSWIGSNEVQTSKRSCYKIQCMIMRPLPSSSAMVFTSDSARNEETASDSNISSTLSEKILKCNHKWTSSGGTETVITFSFHS